MNIDANKQHELFDKFIARKMDMQRIASIVQNDWNDFPIPKEQFDDWFNESISITRGLENDIKEIWKLYYNKPYRPCPPRDERPLDYENERQK